MDVSTFLPDSSRTRFQVFYNSTTWVCPANVNRAFVWLIGGGGGGAGGGSYGGGGGGGGAELVFSPVNIMPGSNVLITIGAGGAGGAPSPSAPSTAIASNGANGGNTIVRFQENASGTLFSYVANGGYGGKAGGNNGGMLMNGRTQRCAGGGQSLDEYDYGCNGGNGATQTNEAGQHGMSSGPFRGYGGRGGIWELDNVAYPGGGGGAGFLLKHVVNESASFLALNGRGGTHTSWSRSGAMAYDAGGGGGGGMGVANGSHVGAGYGAGGDGAYGVVVIAYNTVESDDQPQLIINY